jgi:SSS family solute:Na+ symporter
MALGAALSLRVRRSGDFFVAGRQLGPGLVFATLLAANIGAGSTVGATGLGYREGLSAWWWVGSAGIGSMILAWTVGPRIWDVAQAHNLYTVGDYLELRYDRRVRGAAALLLWLGSLAILAGQFIAVAWILGVTVGFSKPIGCLIAALVTTAYFAAGGLHSSARVNVLQLAVKLAGFILSVTYLWHFGEGQAWVGAGSLHAEGGTAAYVSVFGTGTSGILRYLAIIMPSFIISPGILQKVFAARDRKAVRIGVGLNAAALLAFAIIPPWLGAVARGRFPTLDNSELALPMLLSNSLPLWLGGLLLGAIFSAELSAADAVLFMLTTSLTRDLYQTYIRPRAGDRQLLRITRITASICGAAAALIAMLLPSVISALTVFYSLLTAALFLPLVAGPYTIRVSARGALTSMMVSVAVTFAAEMTSRGRGAFGFPSIVLGMAAGALVMAVMTALEPRIEGGRGDEH